MTGILVLSTYGAISFAMTFAMRIPEASSILMRLHVARTGLSPPLRSSAIPSSYGGPVNAEGARRAAPQDSYRQPEKRIS